MEFIITISEDGMIHPLTKRLYISMLPEEVIFHFSIEVIRMLSLWAENFNLGDGGWENSFLS